MHSGSHPVSTFGATILDATDLRLSREEKTFFRDADPFGFILFARNIESPDQVRALCDEMRQCVGRAAPITIDQEGGRVQRLRAPDWTQWVPPLDEVARAGARAGDAMYLRYRLIAAELRDLGIDSNCAPLVDLVSETTHPFLRDRCYGTDKVNVAAIGRAVADGLLDGGVLPVVKHIPGHGRAAADSHHELPCVSAGPGALKATDFAPFAALNDLPMAMTAHVVFEAIDDVPATLSPRMIEVIRNQIGFDGLLMTDDISMKALQGTPGQVARQSLEAGCDVVLLCNATLETRRAVADVSGRLSAGGQRRAERALGARKTPDLVDIPALKAKLAEMRAGPGND